MLMDNAAKIEEEIIEKLLDIEVREIEKIVMNMQNPQKSF